MSFRLNLFIAFFLFTDLVSRINFKLNVEFFIVTQINTQFELIIRIFNSNLTEFIWD